MNKNFKYMLLSFVSLLMFSNEISAQTVPSFDCAKATSEVEKLICSDDELAKLDVELNYWYNSAIEMQRAANIGYGAQKSSQNEWIKRRNKLECNPKITDKKKCLVSLYKEALQVWKNFMLRAKIQHLCKNRWENSELVYKCDFDGADKLIAEGADINGYDSFYECWRRGPVYCDAMSSGDKNTFDYVVKKGADFRIPFRDSCAERKQALDCPGAWKFFDEIMKLNPNTDLNTGGYLLKVVLSCIWKDSDQQDSDRLKKLLAYGADINQINSQGDNALINIFKNNHFGGRNFPYDYEKTLYMIKFLISQGININHKNNEGHDALYYLRHCPYEIKNKDYYTKFENLLTPQNKGEKQKIKQNFTLIDK